MKIRSITSFYDPRTERAEQQLDGLADFAQEGRKQFVDAGIEVQTIRLATVPFALLHPGRDAAGAVSLARRLEGQARARVCLPLPGSGPRRADGEL